MTKEDFYKVWKDSSREDILNQYYYDYDYMVELIDRKNKAIEYIENNSLYEIEYDEDIYENRTYMSGANDEIASRDLLDILKGSDSNETK